MRRLLALLPVAALLALSAPAQASAVPPICAYWTHGCDVPAYVHEWCVEFTTLDCP